jgi:hypothetical protein
MTIPPSNHQDPTPFGKLLSLLTLLAAALYFTGWIYRWAYYGFFHLEVTTLNLPFESFYLAVVQVMFGDPLTIVRTIGTILIAGLVILFALKLWQQVKDWARPLSRNLPLTNTLQFLSLMTEELIIVLLIVATLFWTAQWQGKVDAWRDAVNETSLLPMITVVLPESGAALGRPLDKSKPLANPSGFRIIGDRDWYDRLLGQELTDTDDPKKPRVWRLLLDRDGYFYIFPALPKKDRFLSFPVLTIYKSSNPLIILSPNLSKN